MPVPRELTPLGTSARSRLHGQVKLPPTGLLNNHREGGLADRLLLTITYDLAISQHLSAPTLLHDNIRVADDADATRCCDLSGEDYS